MRTLAAPHDAEDRGRQWQHADENDRMCGRDILEGEGGQQREPDNATDRHERQ